MIAPVQICKTVLSRLSAMDFEKEGGSSSEQLIFPKKIQAKGTKHKNRISEQELRFLFIEEFKKSNPELFYSIETPTIGKFNFGKSYDTIKSAKDGQSASLDMCVFARSLGSYNRILNIEFKHKNAAIKKIGKDILKLIQENQNGAFIHLLDNTNISTFCNNRETGLFNKFYKSFSDFKIGWSNNDKYIHLVIISLKQETIIHRKIYRADLNILKDIFFIESGSKKLKDINCKGWQVEAIKKCHE